MPSATLHKFGYPTTLLADLAHWSVLVRPAQVTLGSLVLVCKEPVTAFGAVSPAAFAELQAAIAKIESVLARFVAFEKINYLMLMMVDPDVHFHVIPRYAGRRSFAGVEFTDKAWPGPPVLDGAVMLSAYEQSRLVSELRSLWQV